MKLSLFLLCLLFSAMVAAKAESKSQRGRVRNVTEEDDVPVEDVQEEEEEEEEEVDLDGEIDDAAAAATGTAAQQTAAAEPFRFRPSRRLKETSDAMPEHMRRPIASGKVKQTIEAAVAAAMDTEAAAQGLAKLRHEWRLMVVGSEAARVLGTAGANVNRLLTSPEGSEFVSTALATAHVLLSKAGEENRGSGLGHVLSAAFALFASPAMPEIVNKAGGLLLTAVLKPKAALFVRRFWDEVHESLKDQRLGDKLDKCGNNLVSLMKTAHDSDNNYGRRQSPAARAVQGSRSKKY